MRKMFWPILLETDKEKKSSNVPTRIESIMLKTCVIIAITEKVKARWHMPVHILIKVTTLLECARTATWPSTT